MSAAIDLSTQLKDIHLPPQVSSWPPLYSYGVLAGLLLLAGLLCYLLVMAYRTSRRKPKRLALQAIKLLETQSQSPNAFVQSLNGILKRYAMAKYDRQKIAYLNGEAWLGFLMEQASEVTKKKLKDMADILANPYQPVATTYDKKTLCLVAQQWIKESK